MDVHHDIQWRHSTKCTNAQKSDSKSAAVHTPNFMKTQDISKNKQALRSMASLHVARVPWPRTRGPLRGAGLASASQVRRTSQVPRCPARPEPHSSCSESTSRRPTGRPCRGRPVPLTMLGSPEAEGWRQASPLQSRGLGPGSQPPRLLWPRSPSLQASGQHWSWTLEPPVPIVPVPSRQNRPATGSSSPPLPGPPPRAQAGHQELLPSLSPFLAVKTSS